ncbi:uncharacterized protein LOC130823774 isoform X2 [Amaranthus tricolor]|uniref:uncharacterized protein LOC130823774 isoform X2 n=1 Tax=Amaranthus tricolor TaxID=29722 RepID=UPI0025899D57|nr:uncharacterized protein LOC130823774 isoform X2 [Amaranthus tricolor]
MAASANLPSSITLLFILLLLLNYSSSSSSILGSAKTLTESANQKQTKNNQKNQIPNCEEVVDKSHCVSDPKCRWCRSEVLDSMCTSKLEAWRLPSQCPHVRDPAGFALNCVKTLRDDELKSNE